MHSFYKGGWKLHGEPGSPPHLSAHIRHGTHLPAGGSRADRSTCSFKPISSPNLTPPPKASANDLSFSKPQFLICKMGIPAGLTSWDSCED